MTRIIGILTFISFCASPALVHAHGTPLKTMVLQKNLIQKMVFKTDLVKCEYNKADGNHRFVMRGMVSGVSSLAPGLEYIYLATDLKKNHCDAINKKFSSLKNDWDQTSLTVMRSLVREVVINDGVDDLYPLLNFFFPV